MRPRILIAETKDFNEEVAKDLREVGDVDMFNVKEDELSEAFKEYDVIWLRLGFIVDEKVLYGKARCKVLVVSVTGTDHIDEGLCREKGIKVISLKGESEFLKEVRATAELTLCLTLALMRNIIPAYNSVFDGNWDRDAFRGTEIYQKNVGLIGLGRLGCLAANYFKAFGANVSGYDIRSDFPDGVNRIENLKELISSSDIVSVHVAYNKSTEKLISRKEFELFKTDAILINTSRGGVIDEGALLEALKNGRIKGAALDVIENENRVDRDNFLIDYSRHNSNLLIFPHIGGNTYESFKKTEKFLSAKLLNVIKREYN